MIRFCLCAATMLAALTSQSTVRGDMLASYGFGSGDTPDFVAANTTASVFSTGGGLTQISYAGSANARGWNPSNSAGSAITAGDYWTFTVTAAPTFALDLSTLTFDDKRGTNGPTAFEIEVNGILVGPIGTATTAFLSQSYDLSSFTGLTTATIHLIGWNASNNGNTAQWYVDNVVLQGSLHPVQVEQNATQTPLPSTLLLLASGGLPMFGSVRRFFRRKSIAAN